MHTSMYVCVYTGEGLNKSKRSYIDQGVDGNYLRGLLSTFSFIYLAALPIFLNNN